MPTLPPVWWLDDRAASDDRSADYDKIVNDIANFNKNDQKEVNKIREDIKSRFPDFPPPDE